ncbi:DNA-binding protein [Microbacterium bovistercoris]|uniref:DNA-binding protein n=1 Tax=Microbacterium bovistercoris TaxID=2293570 RepID=A0A371NUY7_9MICO|nr:helix-turn-helix domain-containing protein [Microbacterium bovistercoris]REJ06307.1 DNA-binding protein [Microbacterium bovistercoris]
MTTSFDALIDELVSRVAKQVAAELRSDLQQLCRVEAAEPTSPLLTPAEAGAILRVEVQTLADWRYKMVGPRHVKRGTRIFYDLVDIQAYINQSKS